MAAVNFAPIPQRSRLARLRAIVRMRLILTGLLVIAPLTACQYGSLPVSSTSNTVAASASTTIAAPPAVGPACYDTVSRLDVLQEVNRDIARGETRFFFEDGYEGGALEVPGIKGCSKPSDVAVRDRTVAGFMAPQMSISDDSFKCMAAISNFHSDYNRLMAKEFPRSLSTNCDGSNGRIDNSHPRENIPAYRK